MSVFISNSSEENYDAFCLAYMFTFRDFEGGTLGLAWTGDLKNAGGVCEKNGVSFWFYYIITMISILSDNTIMKHVKLTSLKIS